MVLWGRPDPGPGWLCRAADVRLASACAAAAARWYAELSPCDCAAASSKKGSRRRPARDLAMCGMKGARRGAWGGWDRALPREKSVGGWRVLRMRERRRGIRRGGEVGGGRPRRVEAEASYGSWEGEFEGYGDFSYPSAVRICMCDM